MKTFIIALFLLISNTFSSQYIPGLSLTQNGANQIKAHLKLYMPSVAEYLSYTINTNQNTITLNVCYVLYGGTLTSFPEHDFYIDIPNNGNYTLTVNLYTSYEETFCNYEILEDTVTLNFSAPIDGTVSMGTVNADYRNKAIAVFPNPVKDVLHFSEEVTNVKITDVSGKMVKEISVKGKSVNIANLAKGVYIISAVTKSDGIVNRKIVKE